MVTIALNVIIEFLIRGMILKKSLFKRKTKSYEN